KTQAELAADIGRTAGSQTVAALVRTFVLARLLAEEKRKSGPDAYALLHDYLVGAVELATGDVSTQTEEANQLLRYHLAQQRGVIPLRRLRFIRAHADRPLLVQPNARRLLRKSLLVPAVFSGAMVFVAVLMAGGLYLMETAKIQWQAKVIGRHWDEDETGSVEYKIRPERGQVVGGIRKNNRHIRYWDTKDGRIVFNRENNKDMNVLINETGKFILLTDYFWMERNLNCKLINVDDATEVEISPCRQCDFSKSEQHITCRSSSINAIDIALWSIEKEQFIKKVDIIQQNKDDSWSEFQFNNDAERLVVKEGDQQKVISLYDTTSSEKIKNLSDKLKIKDVDFDIFYLNNKVCTFSNDTSGGSDVSIFDLDDGVLISKIKTSVSVSRIYFSADGYYIMLFDFSRIGDTIRLSILSVSDLKPVQGTKLENIYLGGNIIHFNSNPIVYWRDRDDIKLWHVSKGEPVLLKNIKLGDKDKVSSSADMQRAVIWGPQRPAELWDVKEKKKLCSLTSSKDKHIQSAAFSMNDTAVVIEEEGGVASLFDAKDGSPLAQHISAASVYYYDPDLRRIHLWNSSGQVIRHVEGRSYFGWFVPTKKGAMD
uniref:hypothetical protein n=1 Tax=Candidatus Electronema sp. TJ TaxID=3401573 RepID=UPI003AA946BD